MQFLITFKYCNLKQILEGRIVFWNVPPNHSEIKGNVFTPVVSRHKHVVRPVLSAIDGSGCLHSFLTPGRVRLPSFPLLLQVSIVSEALTARGIV